MKNLISPTVLIILHLNDQIHIHRYKFLIREVPYMVSESWWNVMYPWIGTFHKPLLFIQLRRTNTEWTRRVEHSNLQITVTWVRPTRNSYKLLVITAWMKKINLWRTTFAILNRRCKPMRHKTSAYRTCKLEYWIRFHVCESSEKWNKIVDGAIWRTIEIRSGRLYTR